MRVIHAYTIAIVLITKRLPYVTHLPPSPLRDVTLRGEQQIVAYLQWETGEPLFFEKLCVIIC